MTKAVSKAKSTLVAKCLPTFRPGAKALGAGNPGAVSVAPDSECAGRLGAAGRVRYSGLKGAAPGGGDYAYSIVLGLGEKLGEQLLEPSTASREDFSGTSQLSGREAPMQSDSSLGITSSWSDLREARRTLAIFNCAMAILH